MKNQNTEMIQALKISKILFSIKISSAFISGIIEVNNQIYHSEGRKNVLQLKIKDEPVPIPKKVTKLINEVMNEMEMSSEDHSLIKPFMIRGLQLKAFGYSKIKPGAFLGVPESFYFENYPYIVPTNFSYMVENMEFFPDTYVAQALKQSSFLSENAKKFGVAREIYESRHSHIFVIAFTPAFVSSVMLCILLLAQRCRKCLLKLYPVVFSILTMPLETLIFILLRDKIRIYSEGKADFEAAKLGLFYIEGGIEYYEKMIYRHKTLKRLNKDFPFDSDGDINPSRYKPQHMSLLKRIKYLKDLLKAEKTNTKKPEVWNYVFL